MNHPVLRGAGGRNANLDGDGLPRYLMNKLRYPL